MPIPSRTSRGEQRPGDSQGRGRAALSRAESDFLAGQRKMAELLDARHAATDRQIRNVEFHATYWRVLNRLNMAVGLGSYDHATGATQPVEYGKEKEKDKEPEPKKK